MARSPAIAIKAPISFTVTPSTDATKLQTKLIFRAYVVVEYEGVEFVLYTDMYGETFKGEPLSMYDASKAFDEFETSKNVIDIVE